MYNVIFQNSRGQERIIGTVETKEEANKIIDDFLDDHNYKSYYKNCWSRADNTMCVDVGSHTELFLIREAKE